MRMASSVWDRAMAMQAAGKAEDAIAMVRVQQRLRPRDPDLMNLMAVLLWGTGRLDESLRLLERAVALQPANGSFLNNLGVTLSFMNRLHDAVAAWERATSVDPRNPLAWISLAGTLPRIERAADGVTAGRRGIELDPGSPAAHNALASALKHAGSMADAVEAAREAVRLQPDDPRLRSQMLLFMNYASMPAEALAREHRAFGAACPPARAAASTTPDPDRPLRIGVLSGDLKDHSVAFFVDAVLDAVPEGSTCTAFSTMVAPEGDAAAARLRGRFGEWVDAWRLTDDGLDEAIRAREIDVLLELSGHTSGSRLAALRSAPAPVIVTTIGYPNTTGLPAVGWRIVDSVTDPHGSDAHCTERLVRIDPCFLCYRAPQDAPEPAMPAPDALVTFASFNNAAKVGDECAALWGRVLAAVPGSRLLLKSASLADAAVRATVVARMEAAGIASGRLELVARTASRAEHLALYSRVHVALDTVPYNGTTTTCEAMWMGVPVVCMLGDRHASRVSASLVTAAGRPEWAAADADGFVATAARLVEDRTALAAVRTGLRPRMACSALMDAAAYGARFHAAVRECWRGWCCTWGA
jgi:predicted O-linked N-acetylglucosamine transferase (SPINDLY family)